MTADGYSHATNMSFGRSLARFILWTLGIATVLLIVTIFALTQLKAGRTFLAQTINNLASSEDQQITIRNIDGILSGALRVGSVSISDRDGIWLDIKDITLNWRPFTLLSLNFNADSLNVASVNIERAPNIPATTEPQTAKTTVPGIGINLNQINVEQIVLGQQLVGNKTVFELEGKTLKVDRELNNISATIGLQRIDGVKGYLTSEINFSRLDELLKLNAKVHEPAGSGTITYLLGFHQQPQLDMAITSDGSLRDLRININGQFDNQDFINGSFGFGYAQDGDSSNWHINANGTANLTMLPNIDQFNQFIGGATRFTLAATGQDIKQVIIEQLKLANDNLDVKGAGTIYKQKNGNGDFALTATLTPDGDNFVLTAGANQETSISFSDTDLTIALKGSLQAADLQLAANLTKLQASGFTVNNSALVTTTFNADLLKRDIPFQVQLNSQEITSGSADLDGLLTGQLAVMIKGQMIRDKINLTKATINNEALKIVSAANYDLGDQSFKAAVNATIKDQAISILKGRLKQDITLYAAANGKGKAINISKLTVSDNNININGAAGIGSNDDLSANMTVAIADLHTLEPTLKGEFRLTGKLSGTVAKPYLDLQANGKRVSLRDIPIDKPDIRFSGLLSPDPLQGDLNLSALVNNVPLKGNLAMMTDEAGTRIIKDINFDFAGAKIDGQFALPKKLAPGGNLNLDIPDLARFNPLLPIKARGMIKLKALFDKSVSGDDDATGGAKASTNIPSLLKINGTINNLDVAGVVGDDIKLNADIPVPVDGGSIIATNIIANATARIIKVGATHITNLKLNTSKVSDNQINVALDTQVNGEPVTAKAEVTQVENNTTIKVANAAGSLKGQKIRVQAPAIIVMSDKGTEFQRLKLAVANGIIDVAGLIGDKSSLKVTINQLPSAIANSFVSDLGASGNINGNANVTGQISNPDVDFNVSWLKASVAQIRNFNLAPVNITAKGGLNDNKLKVDAKVTNSLGLNTTGTAVVDLNAKPIKLNADINAKAPLAMANGFIANYSFRIDGNLNANAKITGTVSKPEINGSVVVNGRRLVNTSNGFRIENINAKVRLADGRAYIDNASAKFGRKGILNITGQAGIPGLAASDDINIKIKARNVIYSDGEMVTVDAGGDLGINGNISNIINVGGKVTLNRVDVEIPASLPASVSSLAIRHKNAPADITMIKVSNDDKSASSQQKAAVVNMDVAVSSPGKITINGRGLRAEFGGDLRLTGPVNKVKAIGEFDLRSGRLMLLGRKLDITQGAITFDGSLIPSINIVISRQASSRTYSIVMSGQAIEPKFNFESQPQLPQDEILAQMFFGKSVSSLSTFQIIQIADSIATLTGGSGSANVVNKLRSGIGLDDLSVTTDEKGKISATAGKYLTDKIYLNITKSDDPEKEGANLDIDITKSVKGRIGMKSDGNMIGGAFYEYEY